MNCATMERIDDEDLSVDCYCSSKNADILTSQCGEWLVLSHVIFEPRYSMIANRAIRPSCRPFKTGPKRSAPLTPSLCCCSLNIKDTGLLGRSYSTQGYQDSRRARDSLGRDGLKSMEFSERETLRNRLNSFTGQARKSSSIRWFEPCYRQIYPSKKRKATFKIPKKPPYIPAVYQKKTASYRDKYDKVNMEPVKGTRLQWPPLYPSKRKDVPESKKTADKSHELPPWLLPLYSCKSCRNEDAHASSEVRFSGGAFHQKMEFMESIKQIRASQPVLLGHLRVKEATKEEKQHLNAVKTANAVEALKRKIDAMQDYLKATKNMEAYRKKYQTQKTAQERQEPEIPVPLRQPYATIYQTKQPTVERELRVRQSMGLGVPGQQPSDKPRPGTSNAEQHQDIAKEPHDSKLVHTQKTQLGDRVTPNPEVEDSFKITGTKYPLAETNSILSVGEIHKESVVMIKQPSWKKQWNHNIQKGNEESPSNEKKIQIFNGLQNNPPNQGRISPKTDQRLKGELKDVLMVNQQSMDVKVTEKKAAKEVKTPDVWTVESLKSRINVMKIKNTTDDAGENKIEDMSLTRNGGELRPKISQVALRSFHKDAGSKSPRSMAPTNTIKLRPNYQRQMNRRNFSTFKPITPPRPVAKAVGSYRRNISNAPHTNKKQNWISRLRRCFVLKKTKGGKCENWKETPREIPYESEETKFSSPAPILWKPLEIDGNVGSLKSKPAEDVLREKVNPAVLNAERRVLASIGRLISTKPIDTSDDKAVDIEKKMKRANTRVNMIPWRKRSRSVGSNRNSEQLRGLNTPDKDEPQVTGYEWILKNKDMIEELKHQSRCAAGKPLVPTKVKNSINRYKVPLKAEISRYRKKIDQKFTDKFYLCSTSKRWYSTCCAGSHRRILSCSDVLLINTRGIKTVECLKQDDTASNFLYRRTSTDIALRPNSRGYNQGVSYKHRSADETKENISGENHKKRWSWKIPNKTRAFTPKTATLTSPNRIMGTRMSEMSPCALKKQVEELKRLIKKAREEVAEKVDETSTDVQCGNNYEARLKRLVKAAHNNAQKMQITEPKYTSENNMLANRPESGKKNSPQAMVPYETRRLLSPKPKPEVSVLNSLFKKTRGDPNTLTNEILSRNNLTALPALAAKKRSEKQTSRVYLKFKSLVEAVKRKSAMLDPISDMKLLPSKSLKGSLSVNAVVPLSEGIARQSPGTVELLAHKTPAPTNSIQLWKGDTKPKEFHYGNDNEPTYSDILNLFSKAKGLFYYQPPEGNKDEGVDLQTMERHSNPNKGVRDWEEGNEITKQWLSIRKDVSHAAKAVAEERYDGRNCETHAGSFLSQQNQQDAQNVSGYMMNKSKMIPLEFLKSKPVDTCDCMWTSVPVKVQEDGDFCRKQNIGTNEDAEIRLASQPKVENTVVQSKAKESQAADLVIYEGPLLNENESNHQQPRGHISGEPNNFFKAPMMALGSLTKNFGSSVGNLFGKTSESPEPEGAVVSSHHGSSPKTEVSFDPIVNRPHSSNGQMSPVHLEPQSALVGITGSRHVVDTAKEFVPDTATSNSNNEPKNKQQVLECIECMKPLEEKIKTYENYYLNYFADDVLRGYNHLHEVYDGLNKMNTDYQTTMKEPGAIVNRSMETGGLHLSGDIQSERQTKSAETGQDDASIPGKDVTDLTAVCETRTTENGQSNKWHGGSHGESQNGTEADHSQTTDDDQMFLADVKSNTERFNDSKGNVQEGVRAVMSDPTTLAETSKMERAIKDQVEHQVFGGAKMNPTEERANFDELLTHDPTLNPKVVKNLKLPVILSEECHTEKNWYTKYYTRANQDR